MFKLSDLTENIKMPATVRYRTDQSTEPQEGTFNVLFRRLNEDERDELAEIGKQSRETMRRLLKKHADEVGDIDFEAIPQEDRAAWDEAQAQGRQITELYLAHLVGWEIGNGAKGGGLLPVNDEIRAQLLKKREIRAAIETAWRHYLEDRQDEEKNS